MLGETVGDINRPGLALMRGVKALGRGGQEERGEEGKQKDMQKGHRKELNAHLQHGWRHVN